MTRRQCSACACCGSACKTCKQACAAPGRSPPAYRRDAVAITSDIVAMATHVLRRMDKGAAQSNPIFYGKCRMRSARCQTAPATRAVDVEPSPHPGDEPAARQIRSATASVACTCGASSSCMPFFLLTFSLAPRLIDIGEAAMAEAQLVKHFLEHR